MIMKRILIYSLLLLTMSPSLYAQPKTDVRTIETKVADLLMKLPAQNSASLKELMKELASNGEPAIKNITSKLVAPGKGDDAVMRDAISGLTKYAGQATDKKLMTTTSLALVNAIKAAKDDEVRDFLLQEIKYVARDEAIPAVSKYLQSKRLSDPAARVLTYINSSTSNKALYNALAMAKGAAQLSIIKALGETKYPLAAKKLMQIFSTAKDTDAKKVLLRSLAQIGDASSVSLLEAEASKANYQYNPIDATGSYLVFLQRQLEKNNTSLVEKSARTIISNNNIGAQIKSAGLSLLAQSAANKAVPELLSALNSNQNTYRGTAVALLGNIFNSNIADEIQKVIKNSNDAQLQMALINLLGQKEYKPALPLITGFLNTDNKQLQQTAINAVAKTGKTDAIDPLIGLLQKGDGETIAIVKNALLTIAGNNVVDAAAKAIPQSTNNTRIALMDIIAQREAGQYSNLIFKDAENNDPLIKLAAAKALSSVANEGDETRIAQLLNNTDNKEVEAALQNALINVIKIKSAKADQVSIIKNLMQNAAGNKLKYYSVLSGIGGKEALGLVLSDFKNGTDQEKAAALNSMSKWNDFTALDALYQISKSALADDTKNIALNSFISGINKSKNPIDQKVLMFRNAMELAGNVVQKKNILKGISENSSFQALLFVSKYLDDAELQQTAVQAVINIVLDHKELYGKNVEAIANRAIELNKDTESDYLKQALIRHLAALSKEEGFVPMFNGKDLTGWKGLVENPIARAKMTPQQLSEKQKIADEQMRKDWRVENGLLVFEGKGYDNLVSQKMYEDFEMFVDWRMEPKGDGGVYLRGSPQVQTWDTSRVEAGAQVGSGGLYNNTVYASKPLIVADNPINEWNTFRITMIGDKVTVYLNGQLVTNNVILENYWDRNILIFDKEAIELQAHGTRLEFRDIYVKEIPRPKPYELSAQEKKEGFVPLFNGINLNNWTGNKINYYAEGGMIVCDPTNETAKGSTRNLYTEKEYSDFIMRFEFQLTPGANNGLGIRTPTEGDAAYVGMELQILDNEAPIYKDLHNYQYHGSVYGVIPALRGYLKPVGEWNYEEVKAVGNKITITLNGKIILDGDIALASKNNTETADHKQHPGLLNKSGHIGFLGHGSPLKFRNLRIKEL